MSTRTDQLLEMLGVNTRNLEISAEVKKAFINGTFYHFSLERLDKAIASYQEVTATEAKFAPAWLFMGICYCQLGEYEEAIAAYEKATQIHPTSQIAVEAWNGQGFAFEQLKQPQKAAAAYEHALAIDPKNAAARSNQERLQLVAG
ncbi:MAG: tetratricopeptide repeat protein [Coleofasciculaceae cyanobacterium SM2_3_26]|nr:tetratricopeptide repeat protein [Coleofasciculaceae cyanobacterium SM2_3_26]